MIWEMGLPDLEQMRLWIWIPKTDDGISLDPYAGCMHDLVLTKYFMALNLPSNFMTSIFNQVINIINGVYLPDHDCATKILDL